MSASKTYTDIRGTVIDGLERAAAATRGLRESCRVVVQIGYNTVTGDVHISEHVSDNNWTAYNDPDVITVCYARRVMSVDSVLARINDALHIYGGVARA